MIKFRKFITECFACAAVIYLFIGIPLIPVLFRLYAASGHLAVTARRLNLNSNLVLLLGEIFLLSPLILGLVNGIAWLMLKTRRRGARYWAIAASVAFLITTAILVFLDHYLNRQGAIGHPPAFSWVVLTQMLIGLGGLVAFGAENSGDEPAATSKCPRIPGHGTSLVLDGFAVLLQIFGTLELVDYSARWGWQQHLPLVGGAAFWAQWGIVLLIAVLIHEAGHAIAGIALGMKLRAIVIGPFQFQVVEGHWTFEFHPTQLLAFSGAAGLTAVDPDQSCWNEVTVIAAGPFASFLSGAVAAAFAYAAEGSPWRPYWQYFALYASLSLVAAVTNLLPFRIGNAYSDGACILRLLLRGPAADLHRAMRTVTCTLVSPRRPRDIDIDAVNRASAQITAGESALLLRLWALDYYIDTGEPANASAVLAEAERIYAESAAGIPAQLHTPFVINSVLLRRDAAAAREWWQQMENKKPDRYNGDYWLAKTAFRWAEGDISAARAAFHTGKDYVAKLPSTGIYDFDRDRYDQMESILNDLPPSTPGIANRTPDRGGFEVAQPSIASD